MTQVCVVTGASSGFGELAARALAKAGHVVYAGIYAPDGNIKPFEDTARAFAKEHSVDLRSVELNVLLESSISAAIDTVMKAPEGRLDTLVHNAGHMAYGPAEAFSTKQFMDLYDINCVSTQRINKIVLPHMREARQGLLVWVSSSSARGPNSPFLAPYFAAKAAMDSLAQTYAGELTRWGIETSIVVPGVFTKGTNHFATSGAPEDKDIVKQYLEDGPYKGYDEQVMKGSVGLAPPDEDPEDVARAIVDVVNAAYGKRPFRVHVEPGDDGSAVVNGVADRVRREFMRNLGVGDLLVPFKRSP